MLHWKEANDRQSGVLCQTLSASNRPSKLGMIRYYPNYSSKVFICRENPFTELVILRRIDSYLRIGQRI